MEPAELSDTLLVVFSGHFPDAARLGIEVPFEFRRFLGSHPLGVHELFLRDRNMSWYLSGVEVANFISAEQRRLGARRLLTLGSSMGGFAALLFGHLLEADVVLAFGPQVYLDAASRRRLGVNTYGYETRLAEVEQIARLNKCEKYLQLPNLLPLNVGKAFIHLGQNEDADLIQARGLNDQPNITFVVWPGGNHMVVKALRDEGKLFALLRKYLTLQTEAAASDGPAGADLLRARGNELVQASQFAEAAILYSQALQAGAGASHHLVLANRSLCLLKLGRLEDAWYDADAATRLEPRYAKALYRRAQCEVERGFLQSALQTVVKALALEPDNKALRHLKADLDRRIAASPSGPGVDAPYAGYCE